ncbi:MAG: methyltransferase domain-containing protein [Methylococcaceae bacterium]|nr:methyltransferase domain-containing protein [Methylococcaceae bacterium]
MKLSGYPLTEAELESLRPLLALLPRELPTVQQIWALMDLVWSDLGCDEHHPCARLLDAYYRHPIWLLNGLFVDQDPESLGHRKAIAHWIANQRCTTVLDFGGGFGTLARSIAAVSPARIDICEPHPSDCALALATDQPSIRYVAEPHGPYDCVVCTDVIEHVTEPLQLLSCLTQATAMGGHLLLAPCFEPFIRCHLPSTFHLKHTFGVYTRLLGLRHLGLCDGSHAHVFRRDRSILAAAAAFPVLEVASRTLFPLFEWRAGRK